MLELVNETNYQYLNKYTDDQLLDTLNVTRKIDYQSCDESLFQFVQSAFEILDPGVRFSNNWHLGYVCEHLEMVTAGEIQILIINEPPAHMKSLKATVCWPVWTWKDWPESRWIFSSYSSDLSTLHSLKRRRLIKSDWFQSQWADKFQLVGDQDRKTVFENSKKGYFMATSTGGTTGGKHGDFLVIDDPINPEKALSEPSRKDGNNHVDYMVMTRRRDPATSRVVLIMQRLHQDDPVTHMTKMMDKMGWDAKFKIINLPAEAPKKTIITFPKSKQEVVRQEGDILWPERFPKEILKSIKDTLGSFLYAGQYGQDPVPIEGGMVKQEWIGVYKEPPGKIKRCGWFWDTAIKIKTINDWSAGILLAECDNGYYALDMIHKRLLYPQLRNEIITSYNGSPAQFVMVEDKASGQQIVQELKQTVSFPVLPFEPKGDKTQRLSLVSPVIESGKFFLPLDHPLTRIFIDELIFFPHGTHDDCVDACVMGLTYFHLKKKIGTFKNTSVSANLPPMAGALGKKPEW